MLSDDLCTKKIEPRKLLQRKSINIVGYHHVNSDINILSAVFISDFSACIHVIFKLTICDGREI